MISFSNKFVQLENSRKSGCYNFLEFSRWVNVLYDEQMTAALVGRLMHHCHLLLFPGENNRLRESSINDLFRSISSPDKKEDNRHDH